MATNIYHEMVPICTIGVHLLYWLAAKSSPDFHEAKILAPQGAMPFNGSFRGLMPRASRRRLWRGRRELAQAAKTSTVAHSITLNGNQTITWTNGQGVHVSYTQVAGSTTTPVYLPPVNAYETITTVSASSGVPTSLLERDTDKSAPVSVNDMDLYLAFLERHSYRHKYEDDQSTLMVVKNYISRLRRALGDELGSRIVRVRNEGYVYRPLGPDSKGIFEID